MAFEANNLIGTEKRENSIPIIALPKNKLAEWRETSSPSHANWAATQEYEAEYGSTLALPGDDGKVEAILLGLGDGTKPVIWAFANAAARLPKGGYTIDTLDDATAQDAALGWILGQYKFDRYVSDPSKKARFLAIRNVDVAAVATLADAITLVRDLVNTPAEDMGPIALGDIAARIAADHGAKLSVIEGAALLEEELPAIHAVGRAAAEAPRLIDLIWGEENAPKLTLVGKGVCFDTGGLDIKSAAGMRQMKKDMGGGAHALALGQWIMATGLKVRLRVLVSAVENSIAANSYRPGDIIATRKGLSVEIGNTDAEGRVVLSDALTLGAEEAPDLMLDFATLTGAARVALGPDLPALFTSDEDLAVNLRQIGDEIDDPVWRMPLWQPYADGLASPVADLNNISEGGFAGAITAALFLERFVEGAKSWAHFDLFAWNQKDRPGQPKGGEAMTIRTLAKYLSKRFSA